MTKPITLAIVSDRHAGSTLGLCPPHTALDDGGTYNLNRGQSWLWRCWQDYTAQVKAASKGRRLYLIDNGDLVDGDHHATAQVISRLPVTQRTISIDTILPLREMADRYFVIRGTEIHVKSDEEEIGKDLGAEKSPEGQYSWWHLLAEFGGVLFDVAHHPPSGSAIPWGQGGPAVRLAAQAVMDYTGERVPDLSVRSHNHTHGDSSDNVRGTRAILTGAWQLKTGYAYRKPRKRLSDISGLIIQIDAGGYSVERVTYQPGRVVPWREKSK